VSPGRELVDRVNGAERVRDQPGGDDLDPAVSGDLVKLVETQLALIVEREHPEVGAGPAGDVLPGDEVRVVLQLRDHDDVAGPEVIQPPRVGNEVDALGRVPGEDHLAR
jgi:hypothetical protein